MSWRHKDWDARKIANEIMMKKYGIEAEAFPEIEIDVDVVLVEAGADAILEALTKAMPHFKAGELNFKAGTLVFIPDEEDEVSEA